jgi:hypothetical protein
MTSWIYDEKFSTSTVRNTDVHGKRKWQSWAPSSRTIRVESPWGLTNSMTTLPMTIYSGRSEHVFSCFGNLLGRDPHAGFDFNSTSAASYDRSNRQSSATGSQDSITQVNLWWDPNNKARRINTIGRSNQEAVNSSSKCPTINKSTASKCDSSSSSRTPPQPEIQHGPIAKLNLWDRSGLPLQN